MAAAGHLRWASMVLLVATLPGCSGEQPPPDAAFLAELRDLGAPLSMSAAELTRHGRAICQALTSSKSDSQVGTVMHRARIWPDGSSLPDTLADDSARIVAAAKRDLCPRLGREPKGTRV